MVTKRKAYYEKNKERILKQQREYRRNKPINISREQQRKYVKTYRDKLRNAALARFGTKCNYCGFSDSRALQIDHINGGGNKERNETKNYLSYLRKLRDMPEDLLLIEYQLLCANCNMIKG